MAGPSDVIGAPTAESLIPGPEAFAAPLDEDADTGNLFQEINERRARIENAEMLRRLRGL